MAKKDVMSESAREIVINRVIDASRERVFQAWTDPKQIAAWWGPKGFTIKILEADVKPGGLLRFDMFSPDGDDYNNRIAYEAIMKPDGMVYVHGSDDEPDQFEVTVTFKEQGGQTHLTLRMLFPTVEDCEQTKRFGAVEGGNQTLARLAEHLKTTGA